MRQRLQTMRWAAGAALSLALATAGCSTQPTQTNTNTTNSNAGRAAEKKGGTPEDARPMGQTAPGYFMAGPTGNVSLRFNSPQDGQAIAGNSVAPTFTVTGFPIYKDESRNKGQHIHVILDNQPYEADHDPSTPFTPEGGEFSNLKPGTHTLRAFVSREWHESIKQPDGSAFDMVVFNVGNKPAGPEVNQNAPLLTYSRPTGEYRWKEDPRGLLLDFYVTNATISGNDYKVKYTLDGQKSIVLTRWDPVWLQYDQMGPGEHKIVVELLDKDNKPVPFVVGGVNYNRTERKFRIYGEFEDPPANRNQSGNANANRPR